MEWFKRDADIFEGEKEDSVKLSEIIWAEPKNS